MAVRLVSCIAFLFFFFFFFFLGSFAFCVLFFRRLHYMFDMVLFCLAGGSRLDDRMVFSLSSDQVNFSTTIDCFFTLLLLLSLGK